MIFRFVIFHNWYGVYIICLQTYFFLEELNFKKLSIIYFHLPEASAVQRCDGRFDKEVCGFGKSENLVKKCLYASQPVYFPRTSWELEK